MIALTIYHLLLTQNVEPNPGPMNQNTKAFKVITYNCNGLGNKDKLKRILHKSAEIVNKNGIVCLQETHITNTDYLKLIWKIALPHIV
jgi:hypothetical protein